MSLSQRTSIELAQREAESFRRKYPEWEKYASAMHKILSAHPTMSYEQAFISAVQAVPGELIYRYPDKEPILASQTFDPNNISGAALARIGRAVLGMSTPDEIIKNKLVAKIIDSQWLDHRIEEVCTRGRL